MDTIKKINDYSIELTSESTHIPDFDSILENVKKMGKKTHLQNFITSIYNFGLPYRHTICISDDGEVLIAIFEKDHKTLNAPEKVNLGKIQNYR